jgi:hypothetical protein
MTLEKALEKVKGNLALAPVCVRVDFELWDHSDRGRSKLWVSHQSFEQVLAELEAEQALEKAKDEEE